VLSAVMVLEVHLHSSPTSPPPLNPALIQPRFPLPPQPPRFHPVPRIHQERPCLPLSYLFPLALKEILLKRSSDWLMLHNALVLSAGRECLLHVGLTRQPLMSEEVQVQKVGLFLNLLGGGGGFQSGEGGGEREFCEREVMWGC